MRKIFFCLFMIMTFVFPVFCVSAEKEEKPKNLALGKKYTAKSDAANSRSYAERDVDDGIKLTDGKYGRSSWSDSAWVKYYRATGRTVTIDLESNCEINSVKARFISDNPAGCLMPEELTVFVSSDGVNFSKAEILSGSLAPYGHHEKKALRNYNL